MPTEVLTQLRALRESVADSLRKDPRFLTLSALDKSIAEISGVLTTAGLLTEPPPPPPAVHFDAPQSGASPNPVPPAAPPQSPPPRDLSAAAAPASAPVTPPVAAPAPAAAPVSSPAPLAQAPSAAPPQPLSPVVPSGIAAPAAAAEKPKKKRSLLKPLVGAAAALAAVGLTAEAVHLSQGKLGRAAPGTDKEPDPQGDQPHSKADATPPQEPGNEAAGAAGDGVIPEGKASGYTPMAAKPDAPQYQPALSVKFGKLPNKVDLRPLMTPIEDQGDTMSCVANAVAGAYEYWVKKATKQDTNISRLFVYYNARWRDGSQDKDEGSVIQLAMDGLAKFGACNEQVWPFDKRLVIKKPGADAYQEGAAWKVQDMAQVPTTLEAWKQAIAEGKPIVFGIALFDSFDKCSQRGGVVEMPSPEDVARASHSGHAMCAVGYSDTEKVFIVRNSWGPDWGDKGYCYMPYAYLLNPKFNDGDNWVFVPKVPMQPPREVWSDDTRPVTNDGRGVDFVIERFRVEDYEHVAFDFFERVRKPFNTFISQDFSQYVSFARQSLWQSMESFDYRSFLASTVALSGAAIATTAIASEFSSTQTSSTTSLLEQSEEHRLDEAQDEDESSDEEQDEDEASDEDETEDEESDEDETEDEAADEDEAEDEESDEDETEDEEADEDATADEESDEDETEDEESDEDAAEDEESDEDETEDEESDEDESEDDEASDDDDAEDDDTDEDESEDEDDSSDDDDGGDDGDDGDGGDDD